MIAAAIVFGLLFALYMASDDGSNPDHGALLFAALALCILFALAYVAYSAFLYLT